MEASDFNLAESKIAIIGLGLMGGSLALALRGRCAAIYGIDPNPAALKMALDQKIVDAAESDPAALLPATDLLILAAPVPAILTLLKALSALTSNPCIVLDLGSTKKLIMAAMTRLPKNFDPIGGHPICGKEKLSLANAERALYYAAPFLLTPLERTSPRALSAAHQIIAAIGAKPKIVRAAEHDEALAAVSHLPFLLSSALTLATPPAAAALAGPGFKSASRLAGTPSSMMLGVLQSNRQNVLNSIAEFQRQLEKIQSALADEDDEKLEAILIAAQRAYQSLLPNPTP